MIRFLEDTSVHKNPVGPWRRRCPQCSATGPTLIRCTGCRAVRYCSPEHQASHYSLHKAYCNRIKTARAKLAEKDRLVRNATPDSVTPANAFETDFGRFGRILSTRADMYARFDMAHVHLLPLGTMDSVNEALEHLQDMVRLCRSDNMGVRHFIPAVMLRLDLDQECYDFVKWWAARGSDDTYDWGNTNLPHLNIRGADVLEDASFFGRYPDLDHVVAILLLKLKLLVDIRNLKVARKILTLRRLPYDVGELIETAVVRSSLSVRLKRDSPVSLLDKQRRLLNQIRQLGTTLVKANTYFLSCLFKPDEARSQLYAMKSSEEMTGMALALQNSYAAWWETQGVLDMLEDARACAARDSVDEIGAMMEAEALQGEVGHCRTADEMLADASVNRIWEYRDYIVENASYLGPRAERPFERHLRVKKESYERALADGAEPEAMFGDDEGSSVEN